MSRLIRRYRHNGAHAVSNQQRTIIKPATVCQHHGLVHCVCMFVVEWKG